MPTHSLLPVFAVIFMLVAPGALTEPATEEATPPEKARPKPIYSVSTYHPARNPDEDLQATIKRATEEGRRILIQVGGDWCGWCHAMNKYFHENEAVATALAQNFLIMKVNYSDQNRNEQFLERYPKIRGYPHLFVLEEDGTFLHSQGTAVLEEGRSYNEEIMLKFLKKWAPEPKDSPAKPADESEPAA